MKQIFTLLTVLITTMFVNAQYTLTDDDVVVTNGVIESCSYDFALNDIIIPDTLDGQTITGIGDDYANLFYRKGIVSVQLPSTLQTIGDSAFYRNSLSSITIPDSVTYIGNVAFAENLLINLIIPNSVTSIEYEAFSFNSLISVTIPNSVTYIGDRAFSYNNLSSVTIPNSITYIGDGTFSDNSLISVSIPNSVTYIEDGAFSNNSLTNVTISNSVTSIGGYAFYGNSLTSVAFEDSSNIESIGEDAFTDNPDLTSITLPTHANPGFVEYKDENGTSYNPGDNITDFSISYEANIAYTLTDDDVVVTNGVIVSCTYDFAIKEIIIPETLDGQTVTGIGNNVFHNKNIASVQLPSTLQIIGDEAFNSNSLTDVTIPNSVTSIGKWAFYNNSLTGVTIPNSVTSIGDRAFYRNSLISVTIPNSVTSIGEAVFSYNSLTSVTIPNSVISIGIAAFSYNNLTDVTILNSVTYIGDRAFRYNSLISVTIPDSVTYIGDYAFGNNSLTDVTIPNSVTSIGIGAFYDNSLTSIIIPNSVIYMGKRAFYANNLTGVTFEAGSNIVSIEENAFSGNSLTSITLPTHAIPNFVEYKDENGTSYNPGDNITDFNLAYSAVIPYTVTFNDWDGTTLKTETVEHGNSATALAADPTRTGYTFTGWDITFDIVTSDLTVTAQYELNTGIEDILNTTLSIYPNPAHNFIFVESSGLKMKSIQIFDITGKLIKTVSPDAQNIRLDVSDLTAGLHFIKVETGSTSKVLKFVKR